MNQFLLYDLHDISNGYQIYQNRGYYIHFNDNDLGIWSAIMQILKIKRWPTYKGYLSQSIVYAPVINVCPEFYTSDNLMIFFNYIIKQVRDKINSDEIILLT